MLILDLQYFGGNGSASGMSTSYNYDDYAKSLRKWTNDNEEITSKDRDVLEAFIKDRSSNVGPASYAYGLSRGISMTDSELSRLREGGTFTEGKLASWTGQLGRAQSFARNNASDTKTNQVIVRTKSPVKQAAKLAGQFVGNKFAEAETLVSSKAKFKIDKIKKKGQYTEVWVTPK